MAAQKMKIFNVLGNRTIHLEIGNLNINILLFSGELITQIILVRRDEKS